MGERNGTTAQTRVELKTAGWRARREIDELTAAGPAPISSHGKSPCAQARTAPFFARIKGVGPKTATAIVAAIGDGSEFKNGRHLAAWVGLVPRQFSSGREPTEPEYVNPFHREVPKP